MSRISIVCEKSDFRYLLGVFRVISNFESERTEMSQKLEKNSIMVGLMKSDISENELFTTNLQNQITRLEKQNVCFLVNYLVRKTLFVYRK